MQDVKTVSLGKREVTLQTLSGTVAGAKKWTSTQVTGSGGGGYITSSGQGHIDSVEITSSTTEHQEVFVRVNDGQEIPLRFANAGLAIREGHHVSLLQGAVGTSPHSLIAIHNYTTRRSNVFFSRARHLFFPLAAPTIFCLVAAAIAIYAFASSPLSPFPRVNFLMLGKLNRVGLMVFLGVAAAIFIPALLALRRRRVWNRTLRRAIHASMQEMEQQPQR